MNESLGSNEVYVTESVARGDRKAFFYEDDPSVSRHVPESGSGRNLS